MANRAALPDSKLILLQMNNQSVCVDDRRLRTSKMENLRSSPYVGTGTFWVRCEGIASAYGITKDKLESGWKADEWKGKVKDKMMQEHAIVCRSEESGIGFAIPIWEALSSLQMEPVLVGPERIDFH